MSRVWKIQLLMLVFIYSCTILNVYASSIINDSTKLRIPRQAGYVYDKPSVSFNLPARPQISTGVSSTVTSAAPPVSIKTLSQMMYYAYPVPAGGGGESVNIGYSSPSTPGVITSTTTTRPSGGYNYEYQSGTTAGVTQNPSTAISGGYQTGGGVQVSTNAAGYNYNVPSTQGTVSTNAPEYLPPINANEPSPTSRPISPGLPSPTITQAGTSAPPPTLNTSYLLPKPSSTIAPTPSPTPNVSPVVNANPSPSYLPPVAPTQGPTPGTQISVSTPAPTYLPPFFSTI